MKRTKYKNQNQMQETARRRGEQYVPPHKKRQEEAKKKRTRVDTSGVFAAFAQIKKDNKKGGNQDGKNVKENPNGNIGNGSQR